MALLEFAAFLAALPRQGALIGIDPGARRLGVAVSDVTRAIATPLETITRTNFAADAARLQALFRARACAGFVIGLPLNMDGSRGPAAQSARAFANNLVRLSNESILLWDERLSSRAAERALLEADASRKRRAEVIDKMAAAYMLQGALDALKTGSV